MDRLEICGGFAETSWDNCITFTSGEWVTSHALAEKRRSHISWSTEAGVVLMGGEYSSGMTSEMIIQGEYNGVPGFDMHWNTE